MDCAAASGASERSSRSPSEPRTPAFQSTFEVERDLTPSATSFVEYVGDYPNHLRPEQVIDAGATWEIAERQGDAHFGFGLNNASPDHFFGFGYSFRLDGLFQGIPGTERRDQFDPGGCGCLRGWPGGNALAAARRRGLMFSRSSARK